MIFLRLHFNLKALTVTRLVHHSEAQLLPQVQHVLGGTACLVCGGLGKLLLDDFFDKLLGLDAAIWSVHLLVCHKRLTVHFGRNLIACKCHAKS